MNWETEPSNEGEPLPVEVTASIAGNPNHSEYTDDRAVAKEILGGRSAVMAAIDGMGGGGHASAKAAEAIAERVGAMATGLVSVPSVEEGKHLLGKALLAARDDIQKIPEKAYNKNLDAVACVSMICEENGKRFLVVANVGDARMCRFTGKGSEQISRDHSMLAIQVERGELTPTQAFNDPTRNLVYKAVGSLEGVDDINFDVVEIHEGDFFVAFSDGVCDNIPPGQLFDTFWEVVGESYIDQKNGILDLRRVARGLVWRAQLVQIKEDGPNYKRPSYAKKDDTTVVVLYIPRKRK